MKVSNPNRNETRTALKQAATTKTIVAKNTAEPSWLIDRLLEHFSHSDVAMDFRIRWDGTFDDNWEPRSSIPEELVYRYITTYSPWRKRNQKHSRRWFGFLNSCAHWSTLSQRARENELMKRETQINKGKRRCNVPKIGKPVTLWE